MATVSIGCKLPNGLQIDVNDQRVTLLGMNSARVIGGHGITEGVDKELFDKWMADNKDSAAVKNGLIFAHGKTESVAAEAREKIGNVSGFEGLNPEKPGMGVKPEKYENMPKKKE